MKINVNALIGGSAIGFIVIMLGATFFAFVHSMPRVLQMMMEVPQ